MNLTVLAAVTAAISSASVELKAVILCAFDLYTIAPPEYVRAKPVVDLLFVGLFPYAASTKHMSLGCAISSGYFGRVIGDPGIFDLTTLSSSFRGELRLKMIPQSLVDLKYFAICLTQ